MASSKKKTSKRTGEKRYYERDFSLGTIRVYPQGKNRKDFAIISISDAFAITGNVCYGNDGVFFGYPSYKTKEGEYRKLAYCFNSDVIEEINEILADMVD